MNVAATSEARELQAPPASILDIQVEALLGVVNERHEQRLKEVRAKRDAQVQEILQSARVEARESLHQAVTRERSRMAQGLRQAEARAELESRQRAQRETLTLLGQMWERLEAALAARWARERARAAWIAAAVQEAAQLFPGQPWRLEHAGGVPEEEQVRGAAQAGGATPQAIQWHLEPQLRAGLRVRTSGACLDATVEGLLADREDIEGLFLAEYLTVGAAERKTTAAADAPPPAAPGAQP